MESPRQVDNPGKTGLGRGYPVHLLETPTCKLLPPKQDPTLGLLTNKGLLPTVAHREKHQAQTPQLLPRTQ